VSFSSVVVTYNVRLGLDGGLDALGDALAPLDPDVVCLASISPRCSPPVCDARTSPSPAR